MFRIKKNDTVQVIAGADKGKTGLVLAILTKKGKVKVQGIAVRTHHVKARREGEKSQIRKEEAFIDMSNVMPICPTDKKCCRIQVKQLEGGKRVRVSGRSGEAF